MRNTTVGLLALALLFSASAGWYGGRSQMASERADIRQELISQLGKDKELMRVCFSDMQNQFTPGYKSSQVMVDPAHPTISMRQGQIFRTQVSTNLAVNGEGFFLLDTPHGRRYTRDGRFTYEDDGLASDAGQLLGWKLDGNGKRQGEPVALKVPLDPQTKLYDGLYTGLHFDEEGKLFGELSKGGNCPLYQVALAAFANPQLLRRDGVTTFEETSEALLTRSATAGERDLGTIAPASLELSNVEFLQQGEMISALKMHSGLILGCGLPHSPTASTTLQPSSSSYLPTGTVSFPPQPPVVGPNLYATTSAIARGADPLNMNPPPRQKSGFMFDTPSTMGR